MQQQNLSLQSSLAMLVSCIFQQRNPYRTYVIIGFTQVEVYIQSIADRKARLTFSCTVFQKNQTFLPSSHGNTCAHKRQRAFRTHQHTSLTIHVSMKFPRHTVLQRVFEERENASSAQLLIVSEPSFQRLPAQAAGTYRGTTVGFNATDECPRRRLAVGWHSIHQL